MIERFFKYKQVVNTITLDPKVIPNLTAKQKRKIENLAFYSNDWDLIEVLIGVLTVLRGNLEIAKNKMHNVRLEQNHRKGSVKKVSKAINNVKKQKRPSFDPGFA
jgi:hypothetical protein